MATNPRGVVLPLLFSVLVLGTHPSPPSQSQTGASGQERLVATSPQGVTAGPLSLSEMTSTAKMIFVGVVRTATLQVSAAAPDTEVLRVGIDVPSDLFLQGKPAPDSALRRAQAIPFDLSKPKERLLSRFGPAIPIVLDLNVPTAAVVRPGDVEFWLLQPLDVNTWDTSGHYSGFFRVDTNDQEWCVAQNGYENAKLWQGRDGLWIMVDGKVDKVQKGLKSLLARVGINSEAAEVLGREWIYLGSQPDPPAPVPLDLLIATIVVSLNPMR